MTSLFLCHNASAASVLQSQLQRLGGLNPMMKDPRSDSRSLAVPHSSESQHQTMSDTEMPLTGDSGELEEVQFDIPEDAYGASILAVVRDFSVISGGKDWKDETVQLKCIQVGFSFLLLTINLTLQLSLLFFIYTFVVTPAIHRVQHKYQEFHEVIFDIDGNFQEDAWDAYKGKEELCQIGMSSPFFYFTVVFLWVLLIIREFRTTERLARDLASMPTCSTSPEMCTEEEGEVKVVALTSCSKMLIFFGVIIPKMVICSTLMWLGCQWLTATNSFTDLVMNSIAMEFVTGIDEALYETLLPVGHRQQVADINFVLYKKKQPGSNRAKEFAAFKRSFFYLCLSLAFVWLYKMCGQTVLPPHLSDLKLACRALIEENSKNVCSAPIWTGAMGLEDCFPYGTS